MFDARKIESMYGIHLNYSDERLAYNKKNGYTSKTALVPFNDKFKDAEYIIASAEAWLGYNCPIQDFSYYYSFIILKVVSYSDAKLEYPLFGKPYLTPPSLKVQDQGGTVFDLFELHRVNFRNDSHPDEKKALDRADANGVGVSLSDRVFKLIDANNIVPECIPGYHNARGVRIAACSKYETVRKMQLWKENKEMIRKSIRDAYSRQLEAEKRVAAQKAAADTAYKKAVDELDGMFR